MHSHRPHARHLPSLGGVQECVTLCRWSSVVCKAKGGFAAPTWPSTSSKALQVSVSTTASACAPSGAVCGVGGTLMRRPLPWALPAGCCAPSSLAWEWACPAGGVPVSRPSAAGAATWTVACWDFGGVAPAGAASCRELVGSAALRRLSAGSAPHTASGCSAVLPTPPRSSASRQALFVLPAARGGSLLMLPGVGCLALAGRSAGPARLLSRRGFRGLLACCAPGRPPSSRRCTACFWAVVGLSKGAQLPA